jgi:hypothetical protein
MLRTTPQPDGMGVGVEIRSFLVEHGRMRTVCTLVRQGVFGDLACSRIELPDVAFEVCRKPDVACTISHQSMRAGVGCLQLELSHLAVTGSRRPNLFDSCPVYQSAPSGASAGSRGWELGVGTSRSLPAIFAGEASLPASIAACLAAKPATWKWWLKRARKTRAGRRRKSRLRRDAWRNSAAVFTRSSSK